MKRKIPLLPLLAYILFASWMLLLSSCSSISGGAYDRSPNMGPQPSLSERSLKISTEPTGNFYYGRRYHVNKTRFWGYLRKPRQSWANSRLVIMSERDTRQPDRLHEDGPPNFRHGFDQNYEYRITGGYTGRKIYDPNSNLFIPEFKATSYTIVDRSPGWLFSPKDHYDPNLITLTNRSVEQTHF